MFTTDFKASFLIEIITKWTAISKRCCSGFCYIFMVPNKMSNLRVECFLNCKIIPWNIWSTVTSRLFTMHSFSRLGCRVLFCCKGKRSGNRSCWKFLLTWMRIPVETAHSSAGRDKYMNCLEIGFTGDISLLLSRLEWSRVLGQNKAWASWYEGTAA